MKHQMEFLVFGSVAEPDRVRDVSDIDLIWLPFDDARDDDIMANLPASGGPM